MFVVTGTFRGDVGVAQAKVGYHQLPSRAGYKMSLDGGMWHVWRRRYRPQRHHYPPLTRCLGVAGVTSLTPCPAITHKPIKCEPDIAQRCTWVHLKALLTPHPYLPVSTWTHTVIMSKKDMVYPHTNPHTRGEIDQGVETELYRACPTSTETTL